MRWILLGYPVKSTRDLPHLQISQILSPKYLGDSQSLLEMISESLDGGGAVLARGGLRAGRA